MKDAFSLQYRLVEQCRDILFDFLEAETGDDFKTPVPSYLNQSVNDLMQHVAACYINWLGYFGMKLPAGSIDQPKADSLESLRRLYKSVDHLVQDFLEQFSGVLHIEIGGIHDAAGAVKATPAQLFTHVITHEFHHKGQVMTMCRLLGYTPPETDVSLFFNY